MTEHFPRMVTEVNDPGHHVPVMVGATGFEPTTSCSQSRRATKLRYAPYCNFAG